MAALSEHLFELLIGIRVGSFSYQRECRQSRLIFRARYECLLFLKSLKRTLNISDLL